MVAAVSDANPMLQTVIGKVKRRKMLTVCQHRLALRGPDIAAGSGCEKWLGIRSGEEEEGAITA
jgi:hypothetical protein